jgi:hypothetical protein
MDFKNPVMLGFVFWRLRVGVLVRIKGKTKQDKIRQDKTREDKSKEKKKRKEDKK